MPENNVLLVPLQVNALTLAKDQLVVNAMGDFSRLPSSSKGYDLNPDVANLSESALYEAFQNQSLNLKAGIHLHWLLPAFLTREMPAGLQSSLNNNGGVSFPKVPNRWLITKSTSGNNETSFSVENQWIVESDYLYPEHLENPPPAVTIPYRNDQTSTSQPFRYMGRCYPFELWPSNEQHTEYLSPFTAIGYGNPNFHSFYPNCHGIFGWSGAAASSGKVRYEIMGVYGNGQDDYLRNFLIWYQDQFQQENQRPPKNTELAKVLKDSLNLEVDLSQGIPQQVVCYGSIIVNYDQPATVNANSTDEISITMGNTGTEALSAFLSRDLHGVHPYELEDQLEAIQFSATLENKQVDIGPKFQEARLEKAFKASTGGNIWTIRPDSQSSAGKSNTAQRVSLPKEMAHLLNDLNQWQQHIDRANFVLNDSREQLFSDWYKYMLCAYPPEDTEEKYPDMDEVQYYIRHKGINAIKKKVAATGTFDILTHSLTGQIVGAQQQTGTQGALAKKVVESINHVVTALQAYNLNAVHLEDIDEVIDWSGFFSALNASNPPNGITKLATAFSQGVKDILTGSAAAGFKATEDQQYLIIQNLNQLLDQTDFFSASDLSENTVPPQGSTLSQIPPANRTLSETAHLNRIYLEALFPGVFAPIAARWMVLQTIPAAKFWEPTEPVIFMQGEALRPTALKPVAETLATRFLNQTNLSYPLTQQGPGVLNRDQLASAITQLHSEVPEGERPVSEWNANTWNPFLLEWEVEFFPRKWGNNTEQGQYESSYIINNYALPGHSCCLKVNPGREKVVKGANVYSGTSILAPGATSKLQESLDDFLKKQIVVGNLQNPRPDQDSLLSAGAPPLSTSEIETIQTAYEGTLPANLDDEDKAKDALYTAIRAYARLVDNGFYGLSQALSGFNNAMVMHKQTFQLAIADPIGFAHYQHFSDTEVSELVKNFNRVAPEPLLSFNPIRSGELNISRLRLVDTFGQIKDLNVRQLTAAEEMYQPNSQYAVALSPRFMQAARLNLRWLSADPAHNDLEMNSHPATTPICGWILPNLLDSSLAVYDDEGLPLGAISAIEDPKDNALARWDPSPGEDGVLLPEEIKHPHLRKVVTHIRALGPDFAAKFLGALEQAIENIDPSSFSQHKSTALLIGRPLAVVRASVTMELKGNPAIHQGWDIFMNDLSRNEREHNGFTKVKVPIRIGEHRQLNDGVAGYWVEKKGTIPLDHPFYSPQTDPVSLNQDHSAIIYHSETKAHLYTSPESEAVVLTMLVDPRAMIHATTGVLPTSVLTIPPDQYSQALEHISITFLSTPLISPAHQLHIPLPNEAGFDWSWLSIEQGQWSEVSWVGIMKKSTFLNQFDNGDAIWEQLLQKGWLTAFSDNKALVNLPSDRRESTLDPAFTPFRPAIEMILDQSRIQGVETEATFKGKQSIREGWLRLTPAI